VDAPVSEIEANRKMHVLKDQAAGTEPIPVVLTVPVMNLGSVVLKDPKSDQPMATYAVRQILFCARGNAEVLLDCFCLNVRNKRSGMYQCHVFKCGSNQEVSVMREIETWEEMFLCDGMLGFPERSPAAVFSPINTREQC